MFVRIDFRVHPPIKEKNGVFFIDPVLKRMMTANVRMILRGNPPKNGDNPTAGIITSPLGLYRR